MFTVHKPTIAAHKKIKKVKNQLAELLFTYYMSLDTINRAYVELMMDDPDVNDKVK